MYRQASQGTLKIRQNDGKSGKCFKIGSPFGGSRVQLCISFPFCRRPIFAHGEKTSGAGKWDFDHQQSDQKGQGTV